MPRGKETVIGTERLAPNGYLYVKTKTGWRLKHHAIWEEAFGPIPPNHRVAFKDGDRKNIVPTNLTLKEVGRKNNNHNKSLRRELQIVRGLLERAHERLDAVEGELGERATSSVPDRDTGGDPEELMGSDDEASEPDPAVDSNDVGEGTWADDLSF